MSNPNKSASTFLRELRRRKVVHAAILYLAFCALALLAAGFVLPVIGIDASQASQLLQYLAILGFPVICAAAWFFQVTPRGATRTTSFVERRVLRNMAPINDQRHSEDSGSPQTEKTKDYHWIISAETGPLTGLSYGVPDSIVVGRSLECDIALVSQHISRRHARLELQEGQLMIEDLDSSKGTVVNGKSVEGRQPLQHGDELRFHDIVFRVTENAPHRGQEHD